MYGGVGNLKTMIRRLYDIANALTCLNLTAKTHVDRKPAFIWKGPQGIDSMTSRTAVEVKNEEEVSGNTENIPPVEASEPTNEEIVTRVFN